MNIKYTKPYEIVFKIWFRGRIMTTKYDKMVTYITEGRTEPFMENIVRNRINELLAQNNLSAHSFAVKHDMNVSTITDIVAGRCNPRIDTLRKIADAFDVEVVDLFCKPREKDEWSNDTFIVEIRRRAADYDERFKGRVLGYMDRLADEMVGE